MVAPDSADDEILRVSLTQHPPPPPTPRKFQAAKFLACESSPLPGRIPVNPREIPYVRPCHRGADPLANPRSASFLLEPSAWRFYFRE